jgi:acetyl-CoA carboxylase biotin carboxyl carrier protein
MSRADDVAELVALVDGLESLLERAALSELEVEVGGTTVILRTPDAIAPAVVTATATGGPALPEAPPSPPAPATPAHSTHAITAPLTGVYYRSPSPSAEPYVREGGPVSAGQVIGLIEAMKLFNEIKSDVSGIVRRHAAGDGDLVKARQTLIEVEPT